MFKKVLIACAVCVVFMVAPAWAQTRIILDTGDPDERVCNPKSYTDLGNGVIRDNVTGLEWQKATAPGYGSGDYPDEYTYQQALDYCAVLTLGGRSDWRLPSIEELSTLVDSGIPYPGPTINTHYFPDTVASNYWSSTTDAYGTDYAWSVYFNYGGVRYHIKSNYYYVRAVRGGP
jgi:hypothetical protein